MTTPQNQPGIVRIDARLYGRRLGDIVENDGPELHSLRGFGVREGRRRRRWPQLLLALAVGVVAFSFAVPDAFAGVSSSVTPNFPANVTVGQTGVPASLQISNASTPPENVGNLNVNTINLVPSCGTASFVGAGNCPAASADPGVFNLGGTAFGEAGTACAGVTFSITTIDSSTGQVQFRSISGPVVVLSAPGTSNATCIIDFGFQVLKQPTNGTPPFTNVIGFASGNAAVDGVGGTGSGVTQVAVAPTVGVPLASPLVAAGALAVLGLMATAVVLRRRHRTRRQAV